MQITKTCRFNGEVYTMDFPNMDEQQFVAAYDKWMDGELIQNAFPFLSADQREFIMTGTPPEVWDAMFAEPEVDLEYVNVGADI